MQGRRRAIPGENNDLQFVLFLADGTDLQTAPTLAAGDFTVIRDGASDGNADNLPTHIGKGCCRWRMSAAEATAGSEVTLVCQDQTPTQDWLSTAITAKVRELEEVASEFYSGAFGPGIYVDAGGTAGSTLGTHGTEQNPTTTWANALTLAGKLGVNRFYIAGGTTVTMTGSVAEYEFIGRGEFANNVVNLGSQVYSDAVFRNVQVTGTGNASSARAEFVNCYLNAITNLHCAATACGLNGTSTLTNNDDHVFDQCFSMVAGGGTPGLTLAANIDVVMRHYSGGIQWNSGGVTNSVSLEGHGQFVIDATCTNFTLFVRGAFAETDNGTSSTINNDASYNRIAASTDANLISIDGVALATHEAGRVPVPVAGQYSDSIYFDGATAAGTTLGTHGTPTNPSSSAADAYTLSGSSGLNRILVMDGASYAVPASSVSNTEFVGADGLALLTFNGNPTTACAFKNLTVSGTQAISGAENRFRECALSGVTFGIDSVAWRCSLFGTITLSDNHTFNDCRSWFGSTPVFDLAANNSDLFCRGWDGDAQLNNMDATNTALFQGAGHITIDASCLAGTVTIRGDITYTDNTEGAVTVVQDTGVNITAIGGSLSRLDTWNALLDVVENVSITSSSTATSLVAGGLVSTTDDIYIDRVGVFTSGALRGRGFTVLDYNGSSKTLTVDGLPSAPAVSDGFILGA